MHNLRLDRMRNYELPTSFDDPFYEKLIASLKVKQLVFKSDPTQLFYLLEDLAKLTLAQIRLNDKHIALKSQL